MSVKRIATVLFFLLLGTSSSLFAQRVTNAKCGFSLTLPQHWKLTRPPNPTLPPCWYVVESLRKKEACSFQLQTLDGDLETTANGVGFKRQEGKWVMPQEIQMGDTIDAEEISGEHWRGVQAEHVEREAPVPGAVYAPNAKYATQVRTAVVNDGEKRSAVIEGFDCPESRFDKFVQSFRFVPKAR